MGIESTAIRVLETGMTITAANYVDVMALNAKKLAVQPEVLAKALCRLLLLAHITKKHKHRRENSIASVAIPLGCNQRRSIIRTRQPEQAPD